MPTYNAPVEDMLFLYEKLRDNKNYNEIDKYKEVTTDLVKNILEEPAKIPALPVFFKLGDLLNPEGTNSDKFFQSLSVPKNSFILLIASSVVKTGSLGMFIVWKSLVMTIPEYAFNKSNKVKETFLS